MLKVLDINPNCSFLGTKKFNHNSLIRLMGVIGKMGQYMDKNIQVSVLCTVYNQENYLVKCLDGFINQNTNFNYEIIINDDCSTDSSKSLIQKYAEKYPDIIKPIYQEENQFSKGVNIIREIMLPKARGKYIAMCEGDDYWCDNNKLQLQYEYMENHDECSLCCHNTIRHDVSGRTRDIKFNKWKNLHKLNEKETFTDWLVHTSSFFIRKEVLASRPDFAYKYWFGDYTIVTWSYVNGTIAVLPQIMSVYDWNNPNGITYLNAHSNKNTELDRINYLKEFDVYTKNNYYDIIHTVIDSISFEDFFNTTLISMIGLDNKKQKEMVKILLNDKRVNSYCKTHGIKKKLKLHLLSTFLGKKYILLRTYNRINSK